MKKNNPYKILFVFLTILVFLAGNPIFAQKDSAKAEKPSPTLQLTYLKTNGLKTLSMTLTYVEDHQNKPVGNAKIQFFAGQEKQPIGEAVTNEDGKLLVNLARKGNLPKDKDGFYYLYASYPGDEKFEAAEADTKFQDATFTMTLNGNDSIKSVSIKCVQTNEKGEEVPLKEAEVNLYVARMFSNLKVGTGTIDEAGECKIDFPADIPGDSLGNLTILARIEENDIVGNLEAREVVKWGTPVTVKEVAGHRALWTQIAPTWMIITLVIMLSGVWGHYVYAIAKIVHIKRLAKKTNNKLA